MTRAEFRNEYMRLARGHDSEKLCTDERLAAVYDRCSHYDVDDLRAAVSHGLEDLRMPTTDRLHGFLEAAKDRRRARRRVGDDARDKATLDSLSRGEFGRSGASSWEMDGAEACKLAYKRAWDNNQTPIETALVIAELAKVWPFLLDEVHELERMGDHWRNARGEYSGCG